MRYSCISKDLEEYLFCFHSALIRKKSYFLKMHFRFQTSLMRQRKYVNNFQMFNVKRCCNIARLFTIFLNLFISSLLLLTFGARNLSWFDLYSSVLAFLYDIIVILRYSSHFNTLSIQFGFNNFVYSFS